MVKQGWLEEFLGTIERHKEVAIGVGLGLMLATMLGAGMYEDHIKQEADLEKARRGYKLHISDINGNGIPDKYYVINGKPAVVELDGKPVVEKPNIPKELDE